MSKTRNTSDLKKALMYLGFNPSSGKYNFVVALYMFSITSVIANSCYYTVNKWEDVEDRIRGAQTMAFYLILGLQSLVFFFSWDDFMSMIKVIDDDLHRYPFQVTSTRESIVDGIRRGMSKLNRFWVIAIRGCSTFGVAAPIAVFIKTVAMNRLEHINVQGLVTLFPIYYPKGYETIPTYFAMWSMQSAFFVFGAFYGYLGLVGPLLSMQLGIGELQLLQLSVEELDLKMLRTTNFNGVPCSEDIILKSFINYFVKHHSTTYRKITDINRGMQAIVIINIGVSIYVCMGIYLIAETQDLVIKLQEMYICFLWSLDIFCYDYMGEKLATENDKLFRCLYNCSWIDKPHWFKKSLHIILARTQKTVEINPAGLFVMNLNHYAKFVNAAYSYYNILKSFK